MSLTYRQATDIYDSVRKKKYAKPKSTDFRHEVLKHFFPNSENYPDESNLNTIASEIDTVFRKITRYFEKKNRKPSTTSEFPMNEICLTVKDYPTHKKPRTSKPLMDISSKRHQYRRLQPLVDMIKDVAADGQTPEHHLIGFVLHQLYYLKDKKIADIGTKLMNLEESTKVPLEVASSLKCYNNLGRESYQREVRALQTSGYDILPSWKTLRNFEKSITPDIQELPDGLGVEFEYEEAIKLSLKRIFESIDQDKLTEENLTLEIKDGLDGSGSNSIFNQSG